MSTTSLETPITAAPSRDEWFDDFIATLQTHQVMLATGTATKEVEELYRVIFGDEAVLNSILRSKTMMYFVKRIIFDYLKEIGNIDVNVLAFNHSNSHVLVWAEIGDDQEEIEKALILAEAKVNAKYDVFGFSLSTTIIEESDCLEVPSQYILFKESELA